MMPAIKGARGENEEHSEGFLDVFQQSKRWSRRWSSVIVPGIWGNKITEIKFCVLGCKKVRLDRQRSTWPMSFFALLRDFELFLWEWGSQKSFKY